MNQEKKLSERTFIGFVWMLTGSGVQVLLKIGVLAILARLVTPQEFGLVGIAIIVVEFSKLFTQMGVGPAIVQRKELEKRHLTTGFTLCLTMGIFFASMLVLLSPYLSAFFRMEGLTPILKVISVIFFIDSLTLIGQALMQRNLKFRQLATLDVISYALGYGMVGIILAYLGFGVWALVMAHLAQAVVHALLLVWIQPFSKRPRFEYKAFKELLYFGGGMTLGRIGNYLANQGDNLVIGRMLGASALGIYGRAYQFMAMPAGLFGSALDKALFPAMSTIQDDKKKLGRVYINGVSIIALITIPVSIILVLLAPEIVFVFLGPDWVEVTLPFQILACSLLFRTSYKMSDSLARARGAVYNRAWRQILYAILVISGSYIGHFWGIYGVAGGVALALLMNFLLMAQLSIKITSIHWQDILNAHWHGLLLGLGTGIVGFSVITLCRLYIDSHFITILITCFSVVVLGLPLIWYFPGFFIKDQYRSLLSVPIMKVLKKLHPQSV